jgi:hypothetical protein
MIDYTRTKLKQFSDQCISLPTGYNTWVSCEDVYKAWQNWCKQEAVPASGGSCLTPIGFGQAFREACLTIENVSCRRGSGRKQRRGYAGVILKVKV